MPAPVVTIPLSQATLNLLPSNVHKHDYDRTKLKAGIVHFGVGAFHRSHQAILLDRVLHHSLNSNNNVNNDSNNGWGICGVGLLPYDLPMRDAMKAQDCLYTVNEMSPEGKCTTKLVQAMVEYIYAPDDYDMVTSKLMDLNVKIVSLTITEGGYFIDSHSGKFLHDHPAVVKDLANPSQPRSAIGYIVEALERRRASGMPGFTVMSCDNLRHNGAQAKKACLSYANIRDPALAQWIEANVTFPNGMVDRITPAMHADTKEHLRTITGIDDQAPVIAEDFIQWVLEDNFKYGRPAYELAGVMMTKDVLPYEEAKIRLLNGSHSMLAYPAFLAGKRRVDEAMQDAVLADYIRGYLFEDAGKFIQDIPGMDMNKYKEALLQRFSNSAIGDQLARLCLDGGTKIPGFLLPTVTANLQEKGTCHRLAFMLACYNHYIHSNADDNGAEYEVREPNAMDILQPVIASSSPLTLIETTSLVGDASSYSQFVEDYLICCNSVQKIGTYNTLKNLGTLFSVPSL
jgi:mannitol 2-dehydrogenase